MLIVQLATSAGRHPWFERMLLLNKSDGIEQYFCSIAPQGEIHKFLLNHNIKSDQKRRTGVIGLIREIRNLQKTTDELIILAHGYLPSRFALIVNSIFNVQYAIIHHHQPNYFKFAMQRKNSVRFTLHEIIYRLTIRKATFIQSLSDEVTNKLLTLGVPKNRILELGHGIDFSKIPSSSPALKHFCNHDNQVSILMVGRLSWEKNYKLAFQAFKFFSEETPNAVMCIAGSGPELDDLKARVIHEGLEKQIHFLGWQSDIYSVMAQHSMFLHTALTESYCQVLIESKIADMALVSTDVGIARDLSMLCSDTLVSQEFDPLAIAELLLSLNINRTRIFPLSNEARSLYRFHDQEVIFKTLKNYLENEVPKLLANGKS
jgi:glycosyltransferase involved in cell wall biosynthesis